MALKKREERAIAIDEVLHDPALVAPELGEPFGLHGDYESAEEIAARREEGLGRHGFRSLIADLE